MIIWLASYPKSGNTYLRALLASYFFTEDGNFNFETLDSIKLFPHLTLFEKLGIDTSNENEVLKNYIKVQEKINQMNNNSICFIKTHSTLEAVNGNQFTDLKNSLGAIYIIRDPRNTVTSYANHFDISIEQASEDMLSLKYLHGFRANDKFENSVLTHTGSWSSNYNSWKEFKKVDKYLLIKYEDLVLDPKKAFNSVIDFLNKFKKSKHIINEKKLENALKTTSFNSLKNLEKEKGFVEALKDKNNNPVTFFKYGPKNDWKKILPEKIKKKLETSLKKEMSELGYL